MLNQIIKFFIISTISLFFMNNASAEEIISEPREIKIYSFEFGLSGTQLQLRGNYSVPFNENIEVFLKSGIGILPTKNAYYNIDTGSNVELGGRYYFNNNSFYKALLGYSFYFRDDNAPYFYGGIGIGTDLQITKNFYWSIGLDAGTSVQNFPSGLGGILFLRPETNFKFYF